MAHNPLQHLYKQFRSLMLMETSMTPEERKLHQFQLLATVGKRTFLVVKGGANTTGYKVDDGEMKWMLPADLLEKLRSLAERKYIKFVVVGDDRKARSSAPEIGELLASKPKFHAYLLGVGADGKNTKLYEWKTGVLKSEWVKARAK